MKIIRHFELQKNDEFGSYGWQPLWMRGAEPFEAGQGLAHDILEHRFGDYPNLEQEMMAFGVIVWTRMTTNWWHRNGYSLGVRNEDQFQGDFFQFFSQVKYGADDDEYLLSDPGTTTRLRDARLEEMLRESTKSGVLGANKEWISVGEGEETPLINAEDERRIAEWMRRGIRAAKSRYRGRDELDMAHLFDRISKESVKQCRGYESSDYEGFEMTVRADVSTHEVSFDIREPHDPYAY
jgi:hypothetical protein